MSLGLWRSAGSIIPALLVVGCTAGGGEPSVEKKEANRVNAVYTVDSDKSIEQVGADLAEACKKRGFGVLGSHDLQAKMKSKGVDFPEPCLVYEVCNPQKASEVLSQDLRISTALPCRISVYRQGEGTRLATIRPGMMLEMFGAKDLQPVAQEVERTIFAIMQEAAGR